jgi:internalin A
MIQLLFIALVSFIASCSSGKTKPISAISKNIDTIYATTTQLLNSNKIPDSVFQMTKLRRLSIIGMDCDYGNHTNCWDIGEIPSEIKNLTELTTIHLNVNAVSFIPPALAELKNLTTLDLSDNTALLNADNIEKVTSLQHLSLFGCRLSKLPDNIGNLKNLKYLGLTGNNIVEKELWRIRQALPACEIIF